MGLIKSTNAPATLSPFSMRDVEDHARSVLLKARAQAEQLLVAAQEEGEAIRKTAQAEGIADGLRQGMEEGLAAGRAAGAQQALSEQSKMLSALVQALSAVATEIDAMRHQLYEQAADSVTRLAVAIARKATRSQGERDPAVVVANVEAAARLVVESNDVRIVLNPTQRQTLTDALPELKLRWPALAHVELIDDPAIAPGGCMIRTRGGVIDAELDQQIDRIAAELLP